MKIGVFGGTFDPIHLGHLRAARSVMDALLLDRVLFVPAGQPWLKASVPVSPAGDRVEMVRLAMVHRRGFQLSSIEVDRPGPSYAVDTMEVLHGAGGGDTSYFFLLGSDALRDLPRWKEPGRLIQLCRLAAFSRPGFELPDLRDMESEIPGITGRVIMVAIPKWDIQSTEIRSRVSQGQSISGMVPAAVQRYILEHRLYR